MFEKTIYKGISELSSPIPVYGGASSYIKLVTESTSPIMVSGLIKGKDGELIPESIMRDIMGINDSDLTTTTTYKDGIFTIDTTGYDEIVVSGLGLNADTQVILYTERY